jgi:hypothetical protein
MPKDTFWFPHDYEPTGDPKMQAMLSDHGAAGYGIYWRIAEMLHSDKQHKLPYKKYIYQAIAKQMQANAKQNKNLLSKINITPDAVELFIKDCVSEYELFESDEKFFFINRVHRNIEKKENISKLRSKSGKIGGSAKQVVAIAKQTEAIAKQTVAIRGEEIRKEENIILNGNGQIKNAIGSEKVIECARKSWEDKRWREQVCMANSITEDELKR